MRILYVNPPNNGIDNKAYITALQEAGHQVMHIEAPRAEDANKMLKVAEDEQNHFDGVVKAGWVKADDIVAGKVYHDNTVLLEKTRPTGHSWRHQKIVVDGPTAPNEVIDSLVGHYCAAGRL